MVVAERPIEAPKKSKPFTYAPITIIEGEQRSGKSETAITRMVDPTFEGMTAVRLKDGMVVKAEPLLNPQGYPVIGWGKLWLPNQEPKTMKIPAGSCVIADKVKVIYNGHLFGIRYVHMKLPDIIEHLNDGTLEDCYLTVDEAYIGGDRREGMNPLVRTISKLGWQIGKRHIRFTMCLPDSSVLDLRLQKIETEHIVCSYEEYTNKITVFIRNRKKYKRTREVSYYAPLYWKYFDTDEKFQLTDVELARAIAMAQ
jgi:hypothetical protein